METFQWYKGYGIRYNQLNSTTYVEECGYVVKEFKGLGEIEGLKLAKNYIA